MAIDLHQSILHSDYMKTTVEIEESLRRKARAMAATQGTTVKEMLNSSLRRHLENESAPIAAAAIRLHTVKGEGPALETDWGRIQYLIYEDRRE